MTANVNVNGVTGTAATANASLVIQQPTSTCHVTYSPDNWTSSDASPASFSVNGVACS
jgi:hypothetical protein